MIAEYLALPINQQHAFDGRIGTSENLGRTHAQGQSQQELLHLVFVETMFLDELILYLQRVEFLNTFRQFGNARNTFEVHQANHLCQHAGEVQVNHQQIATEHAVGHVAILQHTTQPLNHQHTLGHFVGRFGQGVYLVDRRHGKFHACLLQLQVGRTSAVEQRIHGTQATTYTKARQGSVFLPKSYLEVGTVIGLGFQVVNAYGVEKTFQAVGHFDFFARRMFQDIEHIVGRLAKVGPWKGNRLSLLLRHKLPTTVYLARYHADFVLFYVIPTRAVVFLTLNQRYRPATVHVLLYLRCTHIHASIRQQTEKGINLAQFSFCCFEHTYI